MQRPLRNHYLFTFCLLISCFVLISNTLVAQSNTEIDSAFLYNKRRDSILASQYDISDLIGRIIHPKRKKERSSKRSPITLMPNIAYNPTIGGQIGVKAVAGKVLGDPKIHGVQTMTTGEYTLRVTVSCSPNAQAEVESLIRGEVKRAMERSDALKQALAEESDRKTQAAEEEQARKAEASASQPAQTQAEGPGKPESEKTDAEKTPNTEDKPHSAQ